MPTWKLVFSDHFPAASDVDRSKWVSPHWKPQDNPAYIGRTGIRNPTDFKDRYAQLGLIPCTPQNGADLRFSTYNPLAPGNDAFLGSDLSTIQAWGGNGQPVKFEAQVKCPTMPGGAVTSFFVYSITTIPNRDEIDFEFASNHWTGPGQKLNTNVYVNSDGAGLGPGVQTTAINFQDWNEFTLIWTPNQSVEWQINGNSFLKETRNIPTQAMHMYFNFWAPHSDWGWAYDGGLQPSGAPGHEWHYYVRSATVSYGE
jgi:Glycosyl hydrolases family 16